MSGDCYTAFLKSIAFVVVLVAALVYLVGCAAAPRPAYRPTLGHDRVGLILWTQTTPL